MKCRWIFFSNIARNARVRGAEICVCDFCAEKLKYGICRLHWIHELQPALCVCEHWWWVTSGHTLTHSYSHAALFIFIFISSVTYMSSSKCRAETATWTKMDKCVCVCVWRSTRAVCSGCSLTSSRSSAVPMTTPSSSGISWTCLLTDKWKGGRHHARIRTYPDSR